jgi:ABC-type polysaccharide/polyol phosphate export permease
MVRQQVIGQGPGRREGVRQPVATLTPPAPPSLDRLVVHDPSTVPAEPSADLMYKHRVRPIESLKTLWDHREIIYTLTERDFRAQYKQATLGILWAFISPVLMLGFMIIVFSRVKSFGSEGLPYALYAFTGILCWNFFSNSLGNGGVSLLNNKALLAKTQFPRECFPLENMCLAGINSMTSWIPLALIFVIDQRAPQPEGLWVPLLMAIEIVFAAGVTMAIAGLIIQMRDLVQVLPLITTMGLFATPVIWPYSKIPAKFRLFGGHSKAVLDKHGHLVHHLVGGFTVNLQVVYGFFNPVGPVIDQARWTLLLGHSPEWSLIEAASLGAVLYLYFGYRIFKRLEVNFADIA